MDYTTNIIISVILVLILSFLVSFIIRWILIKFKEDTNYQTENVIAALFAAFIPFIIFVANLKLGIGILSYFFFPQVILIYPVFAVILYFVYSHL